MRDGKRCSWECGRRSRTSSLLINSEEPNEEFTGDCRGYLRGQGRGGARGRWETSTKGGGFFASNGVIFSTQRHIPSFTYDRVYLRLFLILQHHHTSSLERLLFSSDSEILLVVNKSICLKNVPEKLEDRNYQ